MILLVQDGSNLADLTPTAKDLRMAKPAWQSLDREPCPDFGIKWSDIPNQGKCFS
jgi:hypothetical protein